MLNCSLVKYIMCLGPKGRHECRISWSSVLISARLCASQPDRTLVSVYCPLAISEGCEPGPDRVFTAYGAIIFFFLHNVEIIQGAFSHFISRVYLHNVLLLSFPYGSKHICVCIFMTYLWMEGTDLMVLSVYRCYWCVQERGGCIPNHH